MKRIKEKLTREERRIKREEEEKKAIEEEKKAEKERMAEINPYQDQLELCDNLIKYV